MPDPIIHCKHVRRSMLVTALVLVSFKAIASTVSNENVGQDEHTFSGLREVNPPAGPEAGPPTAIVGGLLIDGHGGPPISDSVVVIRGDFVECVGPRSEVAIPDDAILVDATGLSVLPGLIDSHFHHNRNDPTNRLLATFLSRGVTTLRDPGHPIPAYQRVIDSSDPMPRCFLTGRHFDQEPHAYPDDAENVRTPDEARDAVTERLAEGASAIKIYFRLPIDLIKVVCTEAHDRGVPVTGHLELVDAERAIEAGLDGVEHVTSFGTSLAEPEEAERFREAVRLENAARREERFRLWASIDLDQNPRLAPLLELMLARGVVLSPTLAVFERRVGGPDIEDFHIRGFETMKRFVQLCHEAGVPIVIGSHSHVPHAAVGGAHLREMELLVECGLNSAEAIMAATSLNARFLGCVDRLGSISPRINADLILVSGNPLENLDALRGVVRVMLNGRWVTEYSIDD